MCFGLFLLLGYCWWFWLRFRDGASIKIALVLVFLMVSSDRKHQKIERFELYTSVFSFSWRIWIIWSLELVASRDRAVLVVLPLIFLAQGNFLSVLFFFFCECQGLQELNSLPVLIVLIIGFSFNIMPLCSVFFIIFSAFFKKWSTSASADQLDFSFFGFIFFPGSDHFGSAAMLTRFLLFLYACEMVYTVKIML